MASSIAIFWRPTTPIATAGGVVHGDGTGYKITAAGSSGQVITSNGASDPTWGFQPSFSTNLSTSATGSQNNYAPGISGNTVEYWNGASDITITGLATGVTNQVYTFKNESSGHNAFFTHNSASSSAANRLSNLATAVNTPVGVGGSISYIYDGSLWQLVHHFQGNAVAYTPAWTTSGSAPSLGNGTLTGNYVVTNLVVDFKLVLTMGSTTTFGTGNYAFSIPFNISTSKLALCQGAHAGTGNVGTSSFQTASTFSIFNASNGAIWTNANPATWVSTDVLTMQAEATIS